MLFPVWGGRECDCRAPSVQLLVVLVGLKGRSIGLGNSRSDTTRWRGPRGQKACSVMARPSPFGMSTPTTLQPLKETWKVLNPYCCHGFHPSGHQPSRFSTTKHPTTADPTRDESSCASRSRLKKKSKPSYQVKDHGRRPNGSKLIGDTSLHPKGV